MTQMPTAAGLASGFRPRPNGSGQLAPERRELSYPWGDKIEAAKARFNVETGPAPVGQFPANDFGLFDMAGNVSEWCSDWFDREYYQSGPARNPKGPETGMYKVIRGGAWSDEAAPGDRLLSQLGPPHSKAHA